MNYHTNAFIYSSRFSRLLLMTQLATPAANNTKKAVIQEGSHACFTGTEGIQESFVVLCAFPRFGTVSQVGAGSKEGGS